jgi:hypothetical protein
MLVTADGVGHCRLHQKHCDADALCLSQKAEVPADETRGQSQKKSKQSTGEATDPVAVVIPTNTFSSLLLV